MPHSVNIWAVRRLVGRSSVLPLCFFDTRHPDGRETPS